MSDMSTATVPFRDFQSPLSLRGAKRGRFTEKRTQATSRVHTRPRRVIMDAETYRLMKIEAGL